MSCREINHRNVRSAGKMSPEINIITVQTEKLQTCRDPLAIYNNNNNCLLSYISYDPAELSYPDVYSCFSQSSGKLQV